MGSGPQHRPKRVDRTLSRRLAKEELSFKKKLVQARHDSKLSQTDVAELLGVHKSAISRFERADSNPTLSMIRHYAHAIGALVTHDVESNWSADATFVSSADAVRSDAVEAEPAQPAEIDRMIAGWWQLVGAPSHIFPVPSEFARRRNFRMSAFLVAGDNDPDVVPGPQSSAGRVSQSFVESVVV